MLIVRLLEPDTQYSPTSSRGASILPRSIFTARTLYLAIRHISPVCSGVTGGRCKGALPSPEGSSGLRSHDPPERNH